MAAEQLFARIGDISCPVKRPADRKEDRAFRKMIHAACIKDMETTLGNVDQMELEL